MKKILTILLTAFFTVLILITCKKKPEVETYTLTISNENVVVTTTTATITADFSFPTEIYDIKVLISTNSGMSNVTIMPTIISGNTLSITINNLAMNTKYYYCYRYSNNVNIVDTDVKSFTTLNASLPIITTGEVSDITKTTATGSGNVTDNGGDDLIERGICWSTSHNPTIEDNHASNGSGIGNYSILMTGLSVGTTYYVRAYAINSIGTSYGNEVGFTTLANKPTVITNSVTNIAENQAICGGVVTEDGGAPVTERGVCWSTSTNPTTSDQHTTNGNGIGNFVSTLSGLASNTTYYVRAYATNSAGTSYGEQKTFITAKAGWLLYDNGVYQNAWGLISGGTYTWAVMFPSNLLTQYTGTNITKVKFYVNSNGLGTYSIRIYRGGTSAPSTFIHTQDVNVTSVGWKEVAIPSLALETTQPLWIVLSINQQPDQYPASQSTGANNPNARWGCWNGDWHDFGGESDFAWMIRTYVTSATKGEEIELQ